MFRALSFALLCPTEYGGLPMITLTGAAICSLTCSELSRKNSVNNALCFSSASWNVSARQMPS